MGATEAYNYGKIGKYGIDILAHIPHINSCQIPVGFILLIFDLPIPYWHEPIKNKNKNGVFVFVSGSSFQ